VCFFNLIGLKIFPLFQLNSYSTGRSSGRVINKNRFSGYRLNFVKVSSRVVPLDCISRVASIVKKKRKADIMVSIFETGFYGLFTSPDSVKVNAFILNSLSPLPIENGNSMPLKFIPVGSRVFNVTDIAKSAGTSIQILRHKINLTLCKLPSGEIKWLSTYKLATVGVVSNSDSQFKELFKAGQSRWLGRRPVVRGVAMNPIDHPHGGGQGKTAGGRPSVSPYARLTKGYRTVRKLLKNKYIFKKRYA